MTRSLATTENRSRPLAVIMPVKVIQGHWFWYCSETHIRLLITE